LLCAACAGTSETVGLPLQPVGATAAQGGGEKVLVTPFKDQRLSQSHLGMRSHLGGGVTYFDAAGGKAVEAVARMVAEHLARTGRKAWYGKPGEAGAEGQPDVTVTGQIRDLTVNAKSRFGSTVITAKFHITLQALNAADGSTTRLTLDGSREKAVVWFEARDVEELLNSALTESLEKVLIDVKFDNGAWRIK
jgi:hypothetical protein